MASEVQMQGWGAITEGLGAPIRKLLERRTGIPSLIRMADGVEFIVYDIAWCRDAGDMWEHLTANNSPAYNMHQCHFFFLSDVLAVLDPDTGVILLEQTPAPGER